MDSCLKKDLKKDCLVLVEDFLSRAGFYRKGRSQYFIKKESGWDSCIQMVFLNRKEGFGVVFYVALRCVELESFLRGLGFASDFESDYSLCVEVGNALYGSQLVYNIADLNDFGVFSTSVKDVLKAIEFQFFDVYKSMSSIFDLLSPNDMRAWIHSSIHADRFVRVIVLAIMAGRFDKVPKLIEEAKDFMVKTDDINAGKFDVFCADVIRYITR